MSDKRTEIGQLGEFGLITKLTEKFKLSHEKSKIGIGDDGAVLDAKDQKIVISTDMLVEGVHFDLVYSPLKHLGYKAVVVNLSDICAMNAYPEQITVSIAVSNRFSVEALEELYAGIHKACEAYKIDLVGGDTTSSKSGLVISITSIGYQQEEKITQRQNAKEGDLLLVSGDLGAAYMGLQILEREKYVFKEAPQVQPDLSGSEYILERQLKPEARVDIVNLLEDLDIVPTSMIDISDGLSSEIMHITGQSKIGCQLYEEKIPIDKLTYDTAREFDLDPTMCALNGGEDYELLFTIQPEDYEKIKSHPLITVIGHMTEESAGLNLVTKNGLVAPLKAQGWDSTKEEKKDDPSS